MPRLLTLMVVVLLQAGCALRPLYRDFVGAQTTGKDVPLRLVDRATGAGLPNVRVEMSESKSRYTVTTDAMGDFTLPVEKRYLDDNPVLVVSLPAGVKGYQVVVPPPPAPPPPQEPVVVPPADEPVKM